MGGGALPENNVEFEKKRARVATLQREIEEVCKPLVAKWIDVLQSMHCAGALMQTSKDENLKRVGGTVCDDVAGSFMIHAFQSVQTMLEEKSGVFQELDAKCAELDKRAIARLRFQRKRDAGLNRMWRKNRDSDKLAEDLDNAHWDFEELLSEVESEFDFVLIEMNRGAAGNEMAFVRNFAVVSFVPCAEGAATMPGSRKTMADSLRALLSHTRTYHQRKEIYVRGRKLDRIKAKLSPMGVVEMRRVDGSVLGMETITVPKSAPDVRPSPSTASSASTTASFAENAPSPCTSRVSEQILPAPESEGLALVDETPRPSTLRKSGSAPSSQRSISRLSGLSDASGHSGSSAHSEANENENIGFLITERDGWCEYVDRETGDSFWVSAANGERLDVCPY